MSNSCEYCKRYRNHLHGKVKCFVRRMNRNSRHSMVIPQRFVKHFVGKISGTIKLEAPNGNVYNVGVTEHKNRTVLKSGWEAFVDANNIVEKDSLMFRYRGRSRIKVVVFDSSGCEKVVSCARIESTISDEEPSTNSTVMSSCSRDHNTQSSASRRLDGCQSSSSGHCRKRVKTDAISSPSEDLSGEDSSYEHDSFESDDHTLSKPLYVLSGQCYLTEEQEAKIVALVQEIQPEMPLLVAMMKKPNVKPHPDLVISKDYAIAYFPHKSQSITFQLVGQSKKWHCKFRVRPDGGRCNLYGCYFVRDNNLLEGDICLFQPMTNGEGTTFTVMIHMLRKVSIDHPSDGSPVLGSNHGFASTKMTSTVRVKEEPSDASGRSDGCQSGSSSHRINTTKTAALSSASKESGEDSRSEYDSFESDDVQTPPGHDYVLSRRIYLADGQKEKVVMLLPEIQPKTPVFVATMRKLNVQPLYPSLTICKEYAAVHFPHESASVTLQRPGKSKKWHPIFYKKKDGSMHRIRGQWLDFVRDNHVQEGDICIFVPAKGGRKSTFTVHLIRIEATHSRAGTGGKRIGSSHGRTDTRIASAINIKEEPADGENVPLESGMHAVSHESQESKESHGPSEPPYILSLMSRLSPLQKNIVGDKVRAIQSEAPLYVAIMNKTSVGVNRHYVLEFGAQYAAVHLPKREQTLLLQHMGKIWHTKMCIWSGKRHVISGGWRKFVHDNRLGVGDICLFELKNRRKLMMMVHIIFSDQCSL